MIFILEDDSKRMEWFNQIFGQANIVTTDNVKQAIEVLRNQKFDRIFLDFNVGSGTGHKDNGIDVAWALREENLQPDVPVIIHSDDNYGIRHMSRILKDRPDVQAITFKKLCKYF